MNNCKRFIPTSIISGILSTAPEEVVPTVATDQKLKFKDGNEYLRLTEIVTKNERLTPNFGIFFEGITKGFAS